jgi:hypothetical protein
MLQHTFCILIFWFCQRAAGGTKISTYLVLFPNVSWIISLLRVARAPHCSTTLLLRLYAAHHPCREGLIVATYFNSRQRGFVFQCRRARNCESMPPAIDKFFTGEQPFVLNGNNVMDPRMKKTIDEIYGLSVLPHHYCTELRAC